MSKLGDEPAYPFSKKIKFFKVQSSKFGNNDLKFDSEEEISLPGLTKREWFAGMAMQGLIKIIGSKYPYTDESVLNEAEKLALLGADAMLAALESPGDRL